MGELQMPTEIEIRSTLAEHLTLLQTHPTAEQMMTAVVTDDFEVGFRAGRRWCGLDGLRDYLARREGFFDQLYEVKDVITVRELFDGETEIETRVEFFLRRWTAPAPFSDEFTGWCFDSWRLRPSDDGTEFRVAAKIAERFEHLNDNATRLLAISGEGLPG